MTAHSARRLLVVCGASGTVGRRVAGMLSEHHTVRSLSRDPARTGAREIAGEPMAADFADPRSVTRALEGADTVLIITSDPTHPEHDEHLVTAAQRQGVRRLVKLSALAVEDPHAQDFLTNWQRGCEDLVRASGLEWTLLRARAFMSNTLAWTTSVRKEDTVRALHGSARNACVDPGDIAQVAARAMTEPGHAGRSYALTGPEPLSAREQTRQLASLLGRPLRFEELTIEEAMDAWRAKYPEVMVRAMADSAKRQSAGAKQQTAGDVQEILGRPARSYRSWASAHVRCFR
ncbi:NAD(P)H-binding protein [Streptomyces sp. SID5789]|uniref:NAD(P)H-binding protein n=1 Tax=Streptomyces sp. SID5789 TaxID=2690310 RepID=UPI0013716C89|nr:NAD(P)H-binding protein [Streptomyces sp. SID5789]MZE70075.1 NAD(P)H-binding protein [Streptomyces sp. SID5789]